MNRTPAITQLGLACLAVMLLAIAPAQALTVVATVDTSTMQAKPDHELDASVTVEISEENPGLAQQLADGDARIDTTYQWSWLSDGSYSYPDPTDETWTRGSFPTVGTKTIRCRVEATLILIDPETGQESVVTTASDTGEATVEVFLYQVEVEVAKTTLAAGAINSDPHSTAVTVTVTPHDAGVGVDLSIVGGGLGFEGTEGTGENTRRWWGPAYIYIDWYCHNAGDAEPLGWGTDDNGIITATLVSSNKIGDSCAVRAYIASHDQAGVSPTVSFEVGTAELTVPDYFLPGGNQVTVTRTASNDEPLSGHTLFTYVNTVKVDGEWIEFSQSEWETNPSDCTAALAPYASITSGGETATDSNGKTTPTVTVTNDEGVERVKVQSLDVTVHP